MSKTKQENRERHCGDCTYLSYFQKKNDIDPIYGTSSIELIGNCKLYNKYTEVSLKVTLPYAEHKVDGGPFIIGNPVHVNTSIRPDTCNYIDLYNYKGYFNRK